MLTALLAGPADRFLVADGLVKVWTAVELGGRFTEGSVGLVGNSPPLDWPYWASEVPDGLVEGYNT
jgi:hypothetical protein